MLANPDSNWNIEDHYPETGSPDAWKWYVFFCSPHGEVYEGLVFKARSVGDACLSFHDAYPRDSAVCWTISEFSGLWTTLAHYTYLEGKATRLYG